MSFLKLADLDIKIHFSINILIFSGYPGAKVYKCIIVCVWLLPPSLCHILVLLKWKFVSNSDGRRRCFISGWSQGYMICTNSLCLSLFTIFDCSLHLAWPRSHVFLLERETGLGLADSRIGYGDGQELAMFHFCTIFKAFCKGTM